MFLALASLVASALAQDPGMEAAQQGQIAAQVAQQASDQAMRDANLAMQTAQQQAATSDPTPCDRCVAAPKFSVKPGTYSAAVTVKIRDASRGALIYFTLDGWTPTASSLRYTGPITIDSTTTLQAVAISSYGTRSRVAIAAYTLKGTPVTQTTTANPYAPPIHSTSVPLLLVRGTPVRFVFASDVSSKTADVGDKISLTLAEDLETAGMVVAKKGTTATATITGVDRSGVMGRPGEVFFQVDRLQAGGLTIKLLGSAAREGQDQEGKARSLMLFPLPAGLFVRGKDAEIKKGTNFIASVDGDVLLPPAN